MTLAFFFPYLKEGQVQRNVNLVLWGGSRSGKTSILYRWKLGLSIPTVNTVGLLEEQFEYLPKKRTKKAERDTQEGFVSAGTISTVADETESEEDESAPSSIQVNICEVGRDPASLEVMIDDSSALYEDGMGEDNVSLILALVQAICCCRNLSEPLSMSYISNPTSSYSTFLRLWSASVQKADGVIYVVDCSSERSMQDACEDITMILHNDVLRKKNAHLLVLANKQDVYGAYGVEYIREMLHINDTIEQRVKLISCSAMTGQGLEDGLQWIIETCQPKEVREL